MNIIKIIKIINPRDVAMRLLIMAAAMGLASLLFYLNFLLANNDNIFINESFNWYKNNDAVSIAQRVLHYAWHNSALPIAMTTFFLWLWRFSTRLANGVLALAVLSLTSATCSIMDFSTLKQTIYFIILNNLVFFPFVPLLPTANQNEIVLIGDYQTQVQTACYGWLFFLMVILGGALAGVVISGVMSPQYLVSLRLADFFLIAIITVIYSVIYGTIPAVLLAWKVVIFRLRRNIDGVLTLVLLGIAIGTTYGGLTIYVSATFSAEDLWYFYVGGGGVAAIFAYFLPYPYDDNQQAEYGLSALATRKLVGKVLILGVLISTLLPTGFDFVTDMGRFITTIGEFNTRFFIATLKGYFDLSLAVGSLVAMGLAYFKNT